MKRRQAALLVIICIFAITIATTRCGNKTSADSGYFLNLNDTVSYVGKEVCKNCHLSHYESFIQTGMGRSFGLATKERSRAVFDGKAIYDPKVDMYYVAGWKDDSMFITEYRLRGSDTVHKRTVPISHIIGSGHHTNSHFWMDNGYVFQAPLTYYTQKGRWDLPPGYEETNTRFGRKIDMECMSCHNAMPTVAEGSINKFTHIPDGIDCERCHGPGEVHVQLKMQGIIVDTSKEADRSIVNPARLPWKLQVDVCQRCHLQGNNVLKPGKTFADFRPGKALSDVFQVWMPKAQSGSFFMAGHAERLQMSACFKGSNKGDVEAYNPEMNFTCISCHDPHVSVRKTNIQKFNNTCINCHNANSTKSILHSCSESAQKRQSLSNNCVSCHMPSNGTGDIPHVTVHDHYIRKNYSEKATDKSAFELYAVNDESPDRRSETQAYITWFEKFSPEATVRAKAQEKVDALEEDYKLHIQFYYANGAWDKAISYEDKLNTSDLDAWTCYRLAKAYDKTQRMEIALEWYAKAIEKMPLHTDFIAEYANALLRAKRLTESSKMAEKAIKMQGSNVWALTTYGACKTLEGNLGLAKKTLLTAISLDPDYAEARLYLSELYSRIGDKTQAEIQLKEATRISQRRGK